MIQTQYRQLFLSTCLDKLLFPLQANSTWLAKHPEFRCQPSLGLRMEVPSCILQLVLSRVIPCYVMSRSKEKTKGITGVRRAILQVGKGHRLQLSQVNIIIFVSRICPVLQREDKVGALHKKTSTGYYIAGNFPTALFHYLLRGHNMTSNNKTVSRQNLRAGNIAKKSMTLQGNTECWPTTAITTKLNEFPVSKFPAI